MVDEKDESYESQEEGEYHFSDDQANYDLDVESPKKASSAPVAPAASPLGSAKDAAMQKLSQHRRMVIGVVVFIVLISVVYKMLVPAGIEQPPTEFAQPMVAKTAKPIASSAPSQMAATTPTKPAMAEVPAVAPAPTSTPVPVSAPTMAAQPETPMSIPNTSPQTAPMLSQEAQSQVAVQINPASGPPPIQPSAPPMDAATKNVVDRIASLEQQNAALMNLLQTEYAQKMADYETQTTMTRGKLEEVTKRLNRMDTALNQISQALQGNSGMNNGPPPAMVDERMVASPVAAMKVIEPKVVYTVQAIIPGRAWLKSETGETVTVAEGDVLKNYGRITKIDPYDGVVDIDTGNKVITLSYGTNLE